MSASEEKNSCSFPTKDSGQYIDIEELRHWKEQISKSCRIKYNREILCSQRYLRRPMIFIKRLIRKMCRSLIQPIVDEQNAFNANTAAAINALYKNEINIEAFMGDAKKYQEELNILKKMVQDEFQIETFMGNTKKCQEECREKISEELNILKKMVQDEFKQENENSIRKLFQQLRAEVEWHQTQDEMILFRNMKHRLHEQSTDRNIAQCETDAGQTANDGQDIYCGIDYFDFENHFRGSRQEIKRRQSVYIPYYKDKNIVLDLGCGRGEFLELLNENGITGIGVDNYEEFIEFCRAKGLHVVCEEVIQYLMSRENDSVGGVFAAHIIEHLTKDQLLKVVHLSYQKLKQGGYMIMETPNPMCLSTYTNSFYIDPSHQKPVHPKMMEYLLQREGFCNIEILFTEASKNRYRLPQLASGYIDNLDEFNKGIDVVSDLLFGSEDYAVIAQK